MRKKRNIDKRQTIHITIPPELLREVEEQAKTENRNRSNMITEAIRQYLLNKGQVEA